MENIFATVDDLADYIGEPITDELDSKRAMFTLRFASMLVSKETGKTFTDDVPDDIQLVTLGCASRAYLNPEAWTSERIDDWYGAGKPVPEAGLFLTETEKRLLWSHKPKNTGIGVISTFRGDAGTVNGGLVKTSHDNSSTPIPWW